MARGAFTRCTGCQGILPLTPASLAQAGGSVRCGSCGKIFNAIANLFEEFPRADDGPLPAQGTPPLIEPVTPDGEDALPGPPQPGPELALDLSPAPAPAWARILWPAVTLVLAGLVVLQVAGPDGWRTGVPGLTGLSPAAAPADPGEAIQIISRDLHAHPTLDEAIIISAMLTNRSAREIPFPTLEVRLFDASQQVIGLRRLEPAEYVANPESLEAGLKPNVLLPVVLDMVIEGSDPAGFEFRFY